MPRAMRASKLAVRANRACQCCNRPPHFVQVLVAVSFRGASSQSLSTCAGAISKIGEASSCGDDDDDDILSNPRTPETCASDACAAFIASMTDDALQEMATGFATCTGDQAGYQAYAAQAEGWGVTLRKTASDCGLPSALSPLPSPPPLPPSTPPAPPQKCIPQVRYRTNPLPSRSDAHMVNPPPPLAGPGQRIAPQADQSGRPCQ